MARYWLVLLAGQGWDNPPQSPHPRALHKAFRSDSMQVRVGYNILLPPECPQDPDRHYPVVYWLHGLGGNENSDVGTLARVVRPAIHERKVPPFLMVFANGGARTRYHDSTDGKAMAETLVARELMAHIDLTYRTIAEKRGRAIQGMSMGGNGTLKFAFKYPELFSSAVAYAPALLDGEAMASFDPEFLRTMFGGDQDSYQRQFAAEALKKNAQNVRGRVAVLFLVGTKDALLEKNRKMRDLLVELRIPHEYEEREGVGHSLGGLLGHNPMRGLEFAARAFKD